MIIQKLSYLKVSEQSESTCSTIFVTARLCSYHFKNDLPRHFVLMLCTLMFLALYIYICVCVCVCVCAYKCIAIYLGFNMHLRKLMSNFHINPNLSSVI